MPARSTDPGAQKTRKEVLRDFRTDQILDAAARVIGEAGFAEASIDRIAEEAGVARSTVYVYFEGKEDLLNRCLARYRRGLAERVQATVEGTEGVEDRLAAYLEAILSFVGELRQFFQAVMALRGIDPFFLGDAERLAPPELASIRAESQAVLQGIFKDAQLSGELDDASGERAAEIFGTLLYGALMRRSHDPDPRPARAEGRTLARAFLYGIAGAR